MGQKLCGCSSENAEKLNQLEMDPYNYEKLDFNRCSTYGKLENISNNITQEQNLPSQYNCLVQRIIASRQDHLLAILKEIQKPDKRMEFISQLEHIDFEMIDSLFHHQYLKKEVQAKPEPLECVVNWQHYDKIKENQINSNLRADGLKMIQERKIGIVLLAGGKSERYGSIESKVIVDIGLSSKKTLLQLMFEKIKKILFIAEEEQGQGTNTLDNITIFLYVNEYNGYSIRQYLQNHKFFGFTPNQVEIFYQRSISIVDLDGHITFQDAVHPSVAPNGTGHIFLTLQQQLNFRERITDKGIQYLHFIGCENLLGLPLDPIALGLLRQNQSDLLCKCTETTSLTQDQIQILVINNETYLSDTQVNLKESFSDDKFQQDTSNVTRESSDHFIECMNDMYVKTDFLKRLPKEQQKSLKFLQKYHTIKRTKPCYNHKTENDLLIDTIRFEKHLHDIIDATYTTTFYQVHPEEQHAPIIINSKQKGIPQSSILKMSNLHKKWLSINSEDDLEICEISPMVSYAGEGLKHLVQKYQNEQQTFPMII